MVQLGLRIIYKHLAVSFKIYADFKCDLKGVKSSDKKNSSYTEKYQDHIPCSLAYKDVCIGNKFSKKVVLYRGKIQFIDSLKQLLRVMIIVKKKLKKHFNNNLIMYAGEERFKLTNSC